MHRYKKHTEEKHLGQEYLLEEVIFELKEVNRRKRKWKIKKRNIVNKAMGWGVGWVSLRESDAFAIYPEAEEEAWSLCSE